MKGGGGKRGRGTKEAWDEQVGYDRDSYISLFP